MTAGALAAGAVAMLAALPAAAAPLPVQALRPVDVAPDQTTTNPGPERTEDQPAPTLDADDLGLEVVAGFDGFALPRTMMPVTVRLEPNRLLSGTIEVATSMGTTESRQVEVAAGAAKVFSFIVPAGAVRVRVLPDGLDEAVQSRPDVDGSPPGTLVGIGTGATGTRPAGLPAIETVATSERVLWVGFDPALLERSSVVAGSLGTLVLGPDDLDLLGEEGRRNLDAAVKAGLQLVLALPPGPVPADLPWQPATDVVRGPAFASVRPAPSTWTLTAADVGFPGADTQDTAVAASSQVGIGRVIVTGLEPTGAGASAWTQLVAEREATGLLDGNVTSQRQWLAQEALTAGGILDLPALGFLAAFALVYVLAVGPGNALLLRRLGRNELGWVTVPVITVVFVAGAFVAAAGTQPSVGIAGSVRTWVDGAGEEVTIAALRSPIEGAHELTFAGPNWDIEGTANFNGQSVSVDRSSGDVRASLDLQALQIGTFVGRRRLDDAPPLQLETTQDGDQLRITITNVGDRDLTDLILRHAGQIVSMGDLPAGEVLEHAISHDALTPLPVYQEEVMGAVRRFDGTIEPLFAMRQLLPVQVLADRPGQVVVAANDPEAPSTVLADGTRAESIGGVVAVSTTLQPTDVVNPAGVQRDLLVGDLRNAWQPSLHAIEGELTAVLRYRLPDAAAGRVLAVDLDLDRGEGFVEGFFPGVVEPMPPGLGGGDVCIEVTDKFPDGSGGVGTTCGGVDAEPPPCPEDAVTCEFGPDSWTFEFADGHVQFGQITFQDVQVFDQPFRGNGVIQDFLEAYDHRTGNWRLVSDVASDAQLSADYVSPLGEVLIRVSGQMYPFDYSARGIGATLLGASA